MNILVIDLSHHQGDIDWRRVAAAGVYGVIVKASDGISFRDERFVRNAAGAKGAGLAVGAYHFLRAGSPPNKQADLFLNQCHLIGGVGALPLLPWVDVEDPDDDRGAWDHLTIQARQALLGAFLGQVDAVMAEKGIRQRCGIYCPATWFTQEQFGDRSGRPLWAAHPGSEPDLSHTCWSKTGWTIWQYDWKGSVDGIQGDVDMNWLRDGSL